MSSEVRNINFLPPPDIAREYESIYPGFLKWQMDIIEHEADHARKAGIAAREYDIARLRIFENVLKRGQMFGLLIGLFALAAGSYTAISGAEISGGLIGSGGVIGLVAVFVFGRNADKQKLPVEVPQMTDN
ncbi:hypothetical protein [Maritalea sp.]|uniref:hypothetical protein n=1 Tax=Maritalea sp. TaxID=2003361 RepID=UPI003EF20D85